jgi:hypothetical protein
VDAVYSRLGVPILAGRAPRARLDRPDAHTPGWGCAMRPGREDKNIPPDRP